MQRYHNIVGCPGGKNNMAAASVKGSIIISLIVFLMALLILAN